MVTKAPGLVPAPCGATTRVARTPRNPKEPSLFNSFEIHPLVNRLVGDVKIGNYTAPHPDLLAWPLNPILKAVSPAVSPLNATNKRIPPLRGRELPHTTLPLNPAQ